MVRGEGALLDRRPRGILDAAPEPRPPRGRGGGDRAAPENRSGLKPLAPHAEPLSGEIGDALFVLAALAAQCGTSLEEAAAAVLVKQSGRGAPGGQSR